MPKKVIQSLLDLGVLLAVLTAAALIVSAGAELYLKFLLLCLCFSFGYLYQAGIRKAEHRFLLKSQTEQSRSASLMEKASEMSRVSFSTEKSDEDAKLILSFFQDLMSAEKFAVWAKNGRQFKVCLGYRISESLWKIFRTNDRLISRIKSLKSPQSMEAILEEDPPGKGVPRLSKSFRHFSQKAGLNWIFPLGYKSGLLGFILLGSPKTGISQVENTLAKMVCERLRQGLEEKRLREEAEKIEFQLISRLSEEKPEPEESSRIMKKRLFDLHSLFQATEALYKIKDPERLFFTLTSIIQKQMDSKWVAVLVPEEKSSDLVPKCSRGIELASFQSVVMKEQSRFFSWVKQRAEPFFLYNLDQSLKKERMVTLLLGLGVQLACRLILPGGDFGIVLLGEKSEGIRYDSTDSSNFGILTNMATVSLKNIKEFKIVEELSYTDSMTGLYNYRYFYKRLTEEVFRAKRFARKLSLVIFDIDDFKVYNDTFGHQAGDAVLRQLGKFLLTVVRSIDVVSRYGGEEFCVIMPEADAKECVRFMERLRKSIKEYPFKDEYLGHEHHITVSLGGAVYPRDAVDLDRLIYCADMALLRAKNEGRDRLIMFRSEKAALKSLP